VKLYLLDSNDAANFPAHRGITSELYGGGPELRLKQELLLGIGGWRLLDALGIQPEVCHLNEGHAAFAVLERAREFHARDRAALRSRAGRHASGQPLHHPHGGGRRL
jgi:starch phosphorylase